MHANNIHTSATHQANRTTWHFHLRTHGQTYNLLYALHDVPATIDSIPRITQQ